MIKVYFETIPGRSLLPVAYTFGDNSSFNKNVPFQKRVLDTITKPFVERVNAPNDADYLLCPHHYFNEKTNPREYMERLEMLSIQYRKKVIFFMYGDVTEPAPFSHTIVFRTSLYRSEKKDTDIGLPPLVEDLASSTGVSYKSLEGKPVVGFVGWASFDSLKQALRSRTKDIVSQITLRIKGVKNSGMRRKGVFLRKQLMETLSHDPRIDTNFIVRDKYTGNVKLTTREDLERQREEYVHNSTESDFVLAPRGDGNFSLRFFETLSLGRIPVLIDTDVALPLEELIPYEKFVVRVPYKERHNIADFILDFYERHSDEEYRAAQQAARDAFVKYLNTNAFYSHFFINEQIKTHSPATSPTF